MKEELWLKKMKERLDDYSEPLPSDGWERLEKALQPSPVRMKRTIFFRRWTVAAAVALLLVVSSVGVWLLQSPVADEIRNTSMPALAVVPDELPEPAVQEKQTEMPEPVYYNKGRKARTKNLVAQQIDLRDNLEENVLKEEETRTQPVVSEEKAGNNKAEREEDKATVPASNEEKKQAAQHRPVKKEKLTYPTEMKKHKKSKGWSVGISVGNTGGNSLNNTDSWMQDYSVSSVPNGSKVDLISTSNGMVTIPEGQEVVFQGGIPYLLGRSNQVVSIDHKQPVTVGLSLRKGLPKGFSLETGLTYTYLASDVKYAGSSDIVSQKLHYIGIPLRANWNFIDTKRFTVYVSAGGAVEKCVYGTIDSEKETVKPLQLSVLGAVGAQLNLTNHLGFYVEPGVSYFFDDGSDIQTIRKENPCNFTLQAGFRLSY